MDKNDYYLSLFFIILFFLMMFAELCLTIASCHKPEAVAVEEAPETATLDLPPIEGKIEFGKEIDDWWDQLDEVFSKMRE